MAQRKGGGDVFSRFYFSAAPADVLSRVSSRRQAAEAAAEAARLETEANAEKLAAAQAELEAAKHALPECGQHAEYNGHTVQRQSAGGGRNARHSRRSGMLRTWQGRAARWCVPLPNAVVDGARACGTAAYRTGSGTACFVRLIGSARPAWTALVQRRCRPRSRLWLRSESRLPSPPPHPVARHCSLSACAFRWPSWCGDRGSHEPFRSPRSACANVGGERRVESAHRRSRGRRAEKVGRASLEACWLMTIECSCRPQTDTPRFTRSLLAHDD